MEPLSLFVFYSISIPTLFLGGHHNTEAHPYTVEVRNAYECWDDCLAFKLDRVYVSSGWREHQPFGTASALYLISTCLFKIFFFFHLSPSWPVEHPCWLRLDSHSFLPAIKEIVRTQTQIIISPSALLEGLSLDMDSAPWTPLCPCDGSSSDNPQLHIRMLPTRLISFVIFLAYLFSFSIKFCIFKCPSRGKRTI